MYKRTLYNEIKKKLANFPAVAILGPRQVGKTTLAHDISKHIPSVYLDLENYEDFQKLGNLYDYLNLHENKLIILDEIQRYPNLFSKLRGVIDKDKREMGTANSRFLFLGSASNDLLKQSSESLAGRISYLKLSGLNPLEIDALNNPSNIMKLWTRGGFPDSYNAMGEIESYEWRMNFIKTYLEKDIPQLGPKIPVATLLRFWTMLSHMQGENFNASKLAGSLGVASITVSRYLDMMVDLLLIRKLQPWFFNTKKRLIKSPRVYVKDSGILHSLLKISDHDNLLGHPVIGKSWEGFVIESIISILPINVNPFFYRSAKGAEIDLLLEFNLNEYWAVEIKYSKAPKIKKGFYQAIKDMPVKKKFIIYSGNDIFPLGDGITVISLPLFLKEIINKNSFLNNTEK